MTEDWPWRMHTPPKGDYASIPLNAEGRRVADLWTEAQDGSCLAFGAAAVLRMPTRVHITWADDSTLKLETDNGAADAAVSFRSSRGERERAAVATGHVARRVAAVGGRAGARRRGR